MPWSGLENATFLAKRGALCNEGEHAQECLNDQHRTGKVWWSCVDNGHCAHHRRGDDHSGLVPRGEHEQETRADHTPLGAKWCKLGCGCH